MATLVQANTSSVAVFIDGSHHGTHCVNAATPLFSIVTTAGFYSTLAGVLAGFAFTALIFLATARLTASDRADAFSDAMRILVAAFLSLILTSLSYAVLAGDPGTDARTVSEEPVIGVGFAISGALVIYSIVLTLEGAERLISRTPEGGQAVGNSVRNVLAVGVAPLLVLYLYLATQDYEGFRYGQCHGFTALDAVGFVTIAFQIIISWALYPLLVRYGGRTNSRSIQISYAAWAGRITLFLSFASGIAYAITDAYLSASSTLPPVVPLACMLVTLAAMVGMTWLLAYTRSAVDPNELLPKSEAWGAMAEVQNAQEELP